MPYKEENFANHFRKKKKKIPTPQTMNRLIRAIPDYAGPGGSWLSHAKRTYDIFPEVFGAGTKKLSYDSYRSIAIASFTDTEKRRTIKEWAEMGHPTRDKLRAYIKQQQDFERGVSRPDFDLKGSIF